MADQIKHDSSVVVDTDGFVSNSALRTSGVSADVYSSNNTQLVSVTVDDRGRVTAASESSINVTGVTFGEVNASGVGTLEHTPNQKIYISSSAPADNTIGSDGDIWYQTL